MARLRTHPIRSIKSAWDSLEEGKLWSVSGHALSGAPSLPGLAWKEGKPWSILRRALSGDADLPMVVWKEAKHIDSCGDPERTHYFTNAASRNVMEDNSYVPYGGRFWQPPCWV